MNLKKNLVKIKNEIDKMIFKYDSSDLGIFVSLYAYEYIKFHKITKKEFLKSLENSLDILDRKEN